MERFQSENYKLQIDYLTSEIEHSIKLHQGENIMIASFEVDRSLHDHNWRVLNKKFIIMDIVVNP